jgi:uncharacterized membrane protein
MDHLKSKAESQAETEALYVSRRSQTFNDQLAEFKKKSQETETLLRASVAKFVSSSSFLLIFSLPSLQMR